MNERIKKLAEQAGLRFTQLMSNPMVPVVDGKETDLEKFAELIVKECLDIAFEVRGKPATDTHYVIGYDRACEKMIDAIKESYGVEE